MNKERRAKLEKLADELESIKAAVEEIKEAEEMIRDNMSENLQGSSRYEAVELACDNLDGAVDALEEAIGCLSGAAE